MIFKTMIEVYNKALDKTIEVNRIIKKIEGTTQGPTMVFFGGIHGNETAGVFALKTVLEQLQPKDVKGTIYGISGNLQALEVHERYVDKDLNRLWTMDQISTLETQPHRHKEINEQKALFEILKEILDKHSGPLYFIDLHTTSSQTLPFITINDALINRKFSKLFPVPIVLGIEEYLQGPLLSYINELGYVSLGFESGQHDTKSAIENNIAFINLALEFAGIYTSTSKAQHFKQLETTAKGIADIFEIIHLHRILNGDTFEMQYGYKSFEDIKRGEVLALYNQEELGSKYSGKIFMPLYQKQGKEGFFIIRRIRPLFLKLSEWLRHVRADRLFVCLPGIRWESKRREVLRVNLLVAKFLAKPIFHLLGYRSRQLDANHLRISNRERPAKMQMYAKEAWYKVSC
jgi:predicted deacylase